VALLDRRRFGWISQGDCGKKKGNVTTGCDLSLRSDNEWDTPSRGKTGTPDANRPSLQGDFFWPCRETGDSMVPQAIRAKTPGLEALESAISHWIWKISWVVGGDKKTIVASWTETIGVGKR